MGFTTNLAICSSILAEDQSRSRLRSWSGPGEEVAEAPFYQQRWLQ